MRIRFLATVALLALVVAPQAAFAAQSLNVNFADHYGDGNSISMITTSKTAVAMTGAPFLLCSSLNDPKCASSASVTAILPICKSASQANCVEALSVTSPRADSGTASLIRTIGTKAFDADPAAGVPEGSDWSLFEVPQLKAAGDQALYAVKVMVSFEKFPVLGFKATDFSASVVPYSVGTTRTPQTRAEQTFDPISGRSSVSVVGGDPNCIWKENAECGVEGIFPKDSRVKLTVHVGNYLTSWLHGRLTDPNISISAIDTQQNRLTVDAQPVEVPAAKSSQPIDSSDTALVNSFRDVATGKLPPNDINMNIASSDSTALMSFGRFEKLFSNKANRLDSVWSFRALGASAASAALGSSPTTASGLMAALASLGTAPPTSSTSVVADAIGMGGAAAKCSSQVSAITGAVMGTSSSTSLIGLVTTNSLTYDSTPPQFQDGMLVYKVAGLHFNPDDSVFSGRYDLVMDAKVARCLYGYSDSSSPLYASVQIIDSDGTSRVTTSTLREVNGWLKLGVYGFSFSSPTLKVKLTQAAAVAITSTAPTAAPVTAPVAAPATAPVAAPVAAPSGAMAVAPKASAAKTISCMKGKTIKKVTGPNPKCPVGFKLKA